MTSIINYNEFTDDQLKELIEGAFQFLIGRLKTHNSTVFPAPEGPFQFLIGRLKTQAYLETFVEKPVSIPHR